MNKRFRKRGKLDLKQYDIESRYIEYDDDKFDCFDKSWDWYEDYLMEEYMEKMRKKEEEEMEQRWIDYDYEQYINY